MIKSQNGSGAAQQYLYCQSGHPHQLTGVYPTGTTCSNPTGATYSASYDSWGNLTSRTYAGVTATLTYDVLDHLTTWNAGTNNQEWYAYDASGNRVLLRSSTGSGTNITTYPFGLEEHLYNGLGSTLGNTYYYTLGGRLIGALTGANTLSTQFFLTDALGSVLATFSDTAGSAAVLGNQVYGPYGTQRYTQGSMGTAKGYTGQYGDPSGLDYYNARYYDPVVGLFLSADTVQGNLQGMNPYAYVNGNPETYSDPTGQVLIDGGIGNTCMRNPNSAACGNAPAGGYGGSYGPKQHLRISTWMPPKPTRHRSAPVVHHPSNSFWDRLGHGIQQLGGWVSNTWHKLTGPTPPGEMNNPLGIPCGPLTSSFAPMTKVATSRGEKAIGSLHPGERVWAYNPKTHKMELEPVVHVWINHDNDLVDVTIASTIPAQHGRAAHKTGEVVHTNQKHRFLTTEKGFVPVSQLRVGMHVMKAAGGVGIITMLRAIPGTMTMYNLEIAQDHTYTVGEGEWIVHNCGGGPVGNAGPVGSNGEPTMQDILNDPWIVENMTPAQVEQIARQEGWVIGKLGQGTHAGQGFTFRQLNARGTDYNGNFVEWHPGGGRHGPDPYWKVSSGPGGTVRVGPQFQRPATGDIPEGDIPDFIEP